jgi:hypothetical protein
MRTRCRVLTAAVLIGSASPALSQDALFSALQGHSIIVDYQEVGFTPRGPWEARWRDRVYISTQGRIFHRPDVFSTVPRTGGVNELVGEAGGTGSGGRTLVWTGNELTRQWVNRRGVTLRQTITIRRAEGGFVCAMAVERLSGARGPPPETRQTCRVVRGNVFSGQR